MVYNKYMKEMMKDSEEIINSTFKIENFYPEVYNNIYPMVMDEIRNININESITKEMIEKIANDIYFRIDTQNTNKSFNPRKYTTQIRNIALRDLIWIICVLEIFKSNDPIFNNNITNKENKNTEFFKSVRDKTYDLNSNIYEK